MPSVKVPVLSNAITFIFLIFSNVSTLLNKIPFFAPLPTPTKIAIGAAIPIAQGQEIEIVAIKKYNPRSHFSSKPDNSTFPNKPEPFDMSRMFGTNICNKKANTPHSKIIGVNH
ncbi:MAG: hypothetical protein RRZ92_04985, partial [Bacilli bacterium]